MSDPFGYGYAMAEALADTDLAAAGCARSQAAVRAVIALGRCRLFGVAVPGEATMAVAALADYAIPALLVELANWTESARTLGERWDAAHQHGEHDEELLFAMLDIRTDAWAAEAALAAFTEGAPLKLAIARLDKAMRDQITLLSLAVGSNYLENSTVGLIEPRPWWLGEELTAATAAVEEEAAATMPPAEFWQAVQATIEQAEVPQ